MTKTALLTGGSRGIGAATAVLLRERGWTVVAPNRDKLSLFDEESVLAFVRSFKQAHATLDALVLCAGEWYFEDLLDQHLYDFSMQFDLNVTSNWLLIQRLLTMLERAGGCVIAVASTRAFIGGVECAPYAVAKAGLVALMQGFAREHGGPVRFNVVAPSLTATEMGKRVIETGGAKPDAVAQSPEAVATEIVRLIESDDNGRVMRIVDGVATEAKWMW